jgi:hypothetical protein
MGPGRLLLVLRELRVRPSIPLAEGPGPARRHMAVSVQPKTSREELSKVCMPAPLHNVRGPSPGCSRNQATHLPKRTETETQVMWQEWRDSNPQPAVLETAALPIELHSCKAVSRQLSAVSQTNLASLTNFEHAIQRCSLNEERPHAITINHLSCGSSLTDAEG